MQAEEVVGMEIPKKVIDTIDLLDSSFNIKKLDSLWCICY